jgi:hypothetical protein
MVRLERAALAGMQTAEYQEWACESVVMRTKIGDKTTYNLEFQFLYIPGHLHLFVLSEALGGRFDWETATEAASPHNVSFPHSQVRRSMLPSPIKL